MQKKPNFKIDWYLVATFLFGLAPLLWFKKGLMLAGGDESWIIRPLGFLPDIFYSWNEKIFNFGGPNIYLPYSGTLLTFWRFLSSLGVNEIVIEKIWIILLFALPGVSIYLLVKYWLSSSKPSSAGLLAALCYMFNLFVIVIGPYQTNTKLMLFALPLCLLFLYKGLEDNRRSVVFSILLALLLSVINTAFVNIAVIAPIPIVLGAYVVYVLITKKYSAKAVIKVLGISITVWLLLNCFWLYPYLLNMLAFNSNSGGSTFNFVQLNTKQLYNFWRFLGSWAWMDSHNKQLYFPFAPLYKVFPLVYISYSVSAVALFGAWFFRKNKDVLFLITLALLGLVLAKGSTEPIGTWYTFLFKHFKFLWIFREPWAKFTPVLLFSLSILFGIFAAHISQKFRWGKWLAMSFFISLTLFNGYPMLSKAIIWDKQNGSMRTNYVQVPQYWDEMSNYISSNLNENDRILLIPPTGYAAGYSWEHGFFAGDTPAMVLLDRKTIKYTTFPTTLADTLVNKMYDELATNPDKLSLFMHQFSTNYILIDKDINYDISKYMDNAPIALEHTSLYANAIRLSKDITHVRSFGNLELYQLKKPVNTDPVTIISKQKLEYSVNKVSDSEYKVNISQHNTPFTLILNNNYNHLWKANICNDQGCGYAEENTHIVYDGYKNGWNINKTGDLIISLEYLDQYTLKILKLISTIFFVTTMLYLILFQIFDKNNSSKEQ